MKHLANETGEAMEGANGQTHAVDSLKRSLGTVKLVVFVIAAVAPLAAVIGVLPVALVFGSGAALPLAFVLTTIVVALFCVGYSAISREVTSGGAFYIYIAKGLGRQVGLGSAFTAVVSYVTFVPGGLSYLGFVIHTLVLDMLGVDVHWLWFSGVSAIAVGLLGYQKLDFSSRLVLVLISLEFVLLLVFDSGIVFHLHAASLPAQAMNFKALLDGAPGVSLLLAFTCYFGIESAALYSEEAQSPEKSVARSTYIAVALIGIFYFITSWITVGAIGPSNIRSIPEDQVGLIYFQLSDKYVGRVFTHIIQLAVATSMFATVLSIHNVASRYIFVLGRQGCFPRRLGSIHPRFQSPHVASVAVSLISATVVIVAAAFKVHPMLGLGTVALGFAAVGVMLMQVLTSLAVLAYFRTREPRSMWKHVIAPSLSLVGLGVGLAISLKNFEFLSGSNSATVNRLPYLLGIVLLGGIAYASWLRKAHPTRFSSLRFN
ncbi:amino acid/polyamine/organocation transporter, APC superfamily [Burkholderia sp. GAS332]|nr:amino acid/polyamine/organocation transporter, APC superfamily [Burkholderia sp. GAS332]